MSATRHPSGPRGRRRAAGAAERRRVTRELRALAHPLRLRLLEQFARGPSTTMQVAARLGEPPTRLYHHVNALVRAGLLRLRATRPNRGTTEKYYEVARARVGLEDPAQLEDGTMRTVQVLAAQVIEEARRELLAAVAAHAPGAGANARRTKPLPLTARMLVGVPLRRQAAFRKRLVATLRALGREFGVDPETSAGALALTLILAPTLASPAPAVGRSRPRQRRARSRSPQPARARAASGARRRAASRDE